MKLKTLSTSDIGYLIKKSIDALANHPWINTESDVKCALYAYLYNFLSIRIFDLRKCNWRVTTEYPLFDYFVDIAVLSGTEPLFLIELKHLRSISASEIESVVSDFEKHRNYLHSSKGNTTHFIQVVTSTFNGQHKTLVESRLLCLYKDASLSSLSVNEVGAKITYTRVLSFPQ